MEIKIVLPLIAAIIGILIVFGLLGMSIGDTINKAMLGTGDTIKVYSTLSFWIGLIFAIIIVALYIFATIKG